MLVRYFTLCLFSFTLLTPAYAVDDDATGTKNVVEMNIEKEPRMDKALLHQGVFFKNLRDGQKVAKKFKVEFGVRGMTVKPAGELVAGTGHHHLIIDGGEEIVKNGIPRRSVVKKDATHIHFGKGEEETTLELSPGKHTLTLQFADGAHLSYGKTWSHSITVEVK